MDHQANKSADLPTYSDSISAPNMCPPQQGDPQNSSKQNTQRLKKHAQTQPAQVIGVPMLPLGPNSVQVTCPSCRATDMSYVTEVASSRAYICCMMMWLLGLCFCSCLPFYMKSLKNYRHTCPRCHTFFGLYHE